MSLIFCQQGQLRSRGGFQGLFLYSEELPSFFKPPQSMARSKKVWMSDISPQPDLLRQRAWFMSFGLCLWHTQDNKYWQHLLPFTEELLCQAQGSPNYKTRKVKIIVPLLAGLSCLDCKLFVEEVFSFILVFYSLIRESGKSRNLVKI